MCSVFLSAFLLVVIIECGCYRCPEVLEKKSVPEYYLTAACSRSKMTALMSVNRNTLDRCKQLAIDVRAMAFNYSPMERVKKEDVYEENLKTCTVIACPEIENSTTLVSDLRYDYFTIFGNPIPPINSSCVDGIGIFILHQKRLNYSQADKTCRSSNSFLADISTDSRTNRLASLIKNTIPKTESKRLYIGMNDLDLEGDFVTAAGDHLQCTTYRAWAPGHPKQNRKGQNCCTLDSQKLWRVENCSMKLPFICEIYPGGLKPQYDYYGNYESLECIEDEYD